MLFDDDNLPGEEWTPDSVIRFGCDVNIKLMQKELFKIWAG